MTTPGREEEIEDDVPPYIRQIYALKEYQLTTLFVDYGHLVDRDPVLAHAIQAQYYRQVAYITPNNTI